MLGPHSDNPLLNVVTPKHLATPHTYHYENSLDAIKAKKHVLCEKPVTSNRAELRSLLDAAKENDVFFMEAMWTRFQPLSLEFKKISDSGQLGLPISVHADLSGNFDIHSKMIFPFQFSDNLIACQIYLTPIGSWIQNWEVVLCWIC